MGIQEPGKKNKIFQRSYKELKNKIDTQCLKFGSLEM